MKDRTLLVSIESDHPELFDLIMKRRAEQGNCEPPKPTTLLDDDKYSDNFNWSNTQEGNGFWADISCEHFHIYYQRYPKPLIDNFSII